MLVRRCCNGLMVKALTRNGRDLGIDSSSPCIFLARYTEHHNQNGLFIVKQKTTNGRIIEKLMITLTYYFLPSYQFSSSKSWDQEMDKQIKQLPELNDFVHFTASLQH